MPTIATSANVRTLTAFSTSTTSARTTGDAGAAWTPVGARARRGRTIGGKLGTRGSDRASSFACRVLLLHGALRGVALPRHNHVFRLFAVDVDFQRRTVRAH